MKITERKLRQLIREAISENSVNEGVFDAAENWATTLLGQAGIGDAAALIKAVTLDGGRVALNLKQLGDAVAPFGLETLIQVGDRQPSEIDAVSSAIQSGTQEDKDNIKEQVYDTAESIKKFAVSLVSAFPDVVVSTPISAAITTMPIEKFLIAGSEQLAKIVEMYKKFQPAKPKEEERSMIDKITNPLGLPIPGPTSIMSIPGMGGGKPSMGGIGGMGDPIGKAEEIMGDLPSALRYLSQIMDATDASVGSDAIASTATDAGMEAVKTLGKSFITESRLRKLAGLD